MNQKWERPVCVWQRMHDGRPARKSGFSLVDSSPDEVHEVMTLVSDAPAGSLFGELEKITRDSRHSYLAHGHLHFLICGVTVASFLATCLAHQRFTTLTATSRGLATTSLLWWY